MAIEIRKGSDAFAKAVVDSVNTARAALADEAGFYHACATARTTGDSSAPSASALQVTAANGDGTLAVLRTLCINLGVVYTMHIADDLAHQAADDTNELNSGLALVATSNLAACEAFLNDLKAKYNAHLTQSGVHYTNDAANGVTAADADTQPHADTLANQIKTKLNAHITGALPGHSLKLVSA